MHSSPPTSVSHLDWSHIGFGFAFVVFVLACSQLLHLHVGASLAIAALRCIAQLTTMGIVLQHMLITKKSWAVAEITLLLNVLSTVEIVIIKAPRRFRHMFPVVLVAMLVSTIPVSILGVYFAMDVSPFGTPEQYLPVVGILCANAITGISVSLGYILKELCEIHNATERLPGTSRLGEARRPLSVEALRLALMPTIDRMSVMGLVTIPAVVIRAILDDGSDIERAARLQMVIMFMISASNALSCIVATHLALTVCVDSEHCIRFDRIDTRPHWLCRACCSAIDAVVSIAVCTGIFAITNIKHLVQGMRVGNGGHTNSVSERTQLLT